MHDIVIRGGSIIDGSGKPAFTGDVAIAGGRIAAVGGKQGPGRRDIDADGLLVTVNCTMDAPGIVGLLQRKLRAPNGFECIGFIDSGAGCERNFVRRTQAFQGDVRASL